MRVRGILAATMVAAVTAGTGLAGAGTAAAASGCTGPDGNGYYWCYNVRGAPVYDSRETDGYPIPDRIVGYMNSTHSWFHCRRDDGPYVGGPHPNRWLFTKADNGQWGYMKDTSISSETNPVRSC
ncbi:hypothetical protein [Streptomyces sp. NBC_00878]|uniref:hypothetical protein n=1 Tax=Streptomyces sp. NBC_00878 TaxID=2975854 RepID=UPI002254FF7A|nr:hypothetical protein [Streptomyces sp. NBC_00878]MCX4911160.1 hypothetical protein [Streptomyces sp. NBC_00878]